MTCARILPWLDEGRPSAGAALDPAAILAGLLAGLRLPSLDRLGPTGHLLLLEVVALLLILAAPGICRFAVRWTSRIALD